MADRPWRNSSGGSSSSRPWRATSRGSVKAQTKKKDHDDDGGFLRDVAGFAENVSEGLRDLAVASGPGALELGKFVAARPGTAGFTRRAERNREFLRAVERDYRKRYGPLVRGDFGEFAHQLYEEPVPFALDAATLASLGAGTVSRGSAAARAAKTGGFRAAARAARHGPPTELRKVMVPIEGKGEVEALLGTYSRSTLTRQTQKWLDGIRQKFPNAPVMGRSLYRKVGFQQQRLGAIEENIGRIGAEEVLSVAGGRRLNVAQHRALRVVGEGVPLDKRIAKHRADLSVAKNARQAKRLRGEIRLLEKSRKYLDESGTKITDPKLAAVYDLVKQSTKRREDLLALVDELAPERAAARVSKPAEIFGSVEGRGRLAELESVLEQRLKPLVDEAFPPEARAREQSMRNILPHTRGKRATAGLEREIEAMGGTGRSSSVLANAYEQIEEQILRLAAKPNPDPTVARVAGLITERDRLRTLLNDPETVFTGKLPTAAAGETFFTYSSRKRPTGFSRLGASRVIRHPKRPGTSQTFTGEAITQGRIPQGEAVLAAEAELEAWRFTTILRNRERLAELGKPLPTKGSDVALVLDELKGKTLPDEVKALLGKATTGEVLREEQLTVLARVSEGLRQQIFPGKWDDLKHLDQFRAAVDKPIPGVVWIDPRLLGGIHATNPLVGFSGNMAARAGLATLDAINNASKMAILYLLPLKYISPNLISQTAFALIQQGFAAPRNLATAAKLNQKLGRRATLAIDAGMGEGFAASIAGHTTGPLTRANQAAARLYGKVIDLPFRRASFLHEANRAGFDTPAKITKLLDDPALREQRLAIFLEANAEIIDYARLGKFERAFIRRIIFFYPWVKGATVYSARFLIEHPGKAWALDQLGKIGSEAQADILGDLLPSFAEALAPVGTKDGLPTTVNLGAVSPFTTPYGVLRAALGDPRSAYALGNQFSPALNAGIMATGFTPPGGYRSGPRAALEELYQALPEFYYGNRILNGPPERASYPTTTWEAVLSLLLGTGVTPRRTDPERLREQAERGR